MKLMGTLFQEQMMHMEKVTKYKYLTTPNLIYMKTKILGL